MRNRTTFAPVSSYDVKGKDCVPRLLIGSVPIPFPLERAGEMSSLFALMTAALQSYHHQKFSPTAKPSLKSSLRYDYNEDTRDDRAMPSSGNWFRGFVELAGAPVLGGDANFLKSGGAFSHTRPFGPLSMFGGMRGPSLTISAEAEAVQAFGSDWEKARRRGTSGVRIIDRIFLGGPLNVRGFKHRAA